MRNTPLSKFFKTSIAVLAIAVISACAPKNATTAVATDEAAVPVVNEPGPEPTIEASPTLEPAVQAAAPAVYTLEEVALHSNENDCWLVVNGGVFNVTSFISEHPGGMRILEGCGKDASTLFEGVDDHIGRAVGLLVTYQIGLLAE